MNFILPFCFIVHPLSINKMTGFSIITLKCIFIYLQIAPHVVLSETEIENKMRLDYDDFLKEELAFLRELGLKTDDDTGGDT